MAEDDEKTKSYKRIGTEGVEPVSVPILAPGIGTRISESAARLGPRREAAMRIGVSPASLQRYIGEEVMPPFDAMAALCITSGARFQWLAFAQGGMLDTEETAAQSRSQSVRLEELTMAIQLVDEALEGKTLEAAKRAELVGLVYEGLVEGLPEATVLRWARTASK